MATLAIMHFCHHSYKGVNVDYKPLLPPSPVPSAFLLELKNRRSFVGNSSNRVNNHMVRDQENKPAVEVPECDVLIGNLTSRGDL
ncbi:hypothetical protein AVEN_69083-1 [Araneus ventricosus]|uniref:Uncharacterized protein n=1 Tax=Araneus ventricosus TaxID=182803 RepID=A0A4Y2VSH7_ARAVE|nr:hypothetical protein AVEN_46783-1 [Araneus ventricosus]GBO28109.1 hypothetical protein AVEN_69083-1 [Araneus ventricosus]